MQWHDGTTSIKWLNENPDKTATERVKYIPQNFLENLCANVESDDFEKELKQIIFSHTPSDKRLGKTSLDELINYKSSLISEVITQIQNGLARTNIEIVRLENQSTEDYRHSVSDKLKTKKEEKAAHLSIKPIPPSTDDQQVADSQQLQRLDDLRRKITDLETELTALNSRKSALALNIEDLGRALQYYTNLDGQLKGIIGPTQHVNSLFEQGIDASSVFSYHLDTSPISAKVSELQQSLANIDLQLSAQLPESKVSQLAALKNALKTEQAKLDKPAKDHQRYLDNLKAWEARQKQIEGDKMTEDSLLFYEGQLAYLRDKLPAELKTNYQQRDKLVEQLYEKKIGLITIRKELFQPVTQFIAEFKELKKRYDVKIDVALELRSFADTFFLNINQQRKGTFAGKEEGYKKLMEIIERANFTSREGFLAFTNELIDHLRIDKRGSGAEKIEIGTQLRNGIELNQLYDFIFSFNYLQPVYNLKLGNKTLQELSPGERGALLLIFYLILDKDDIPLIIDQPEENLDNESVYHILVHFIKKVKENRQIIIVTHNPNLAIVCDADQIVQMNIEKDNKNAVHFYSGSIEDDLMNEKIINILEGTLPAFNNRDSKYIRVKQ